MFHAQLRRPCGTSNFFRCLNNLARSIFSRERSILFIKYLSKSFITFSIFLSLFITIAAQDTASSKIRKMLPARVADFRSVSIRPLVSLSKENLLAPENFRIEDGNEGKQAFTGAESDYISASGEKLTVEIVKLQSDADAYALLTHIAAKMQEPITTQKQNGIGSANIVSPGHAAFYKGSTFVRVTNASVRTGGGGDDAATIKLAQLFAETLDGGEGEIPVLVKHLPEWETAQAHAAYAVSLASLKNIIEGQPSLDALNFVEGTEAVAAPYDSSQLVIVEYTTPQIAADNDTRIRESMEKLRVENQPVPSAYRRVGNYSVFVFNAPDAQTAGRLINQVHYEQLVQWLGDNPRALQRAQREYAATTAGMILAVLKASGLALILCLGAGGMLGSIVFLRRRAQQTSNAAYTDSGGLMRLNLDDLTAQTDSARLLGKGGN